MDFFITPTFDWTPPSLDVLNFSDCDLATRFTAIRWLDRELPLQLTIDYVKHGLAQYVDQQGISPPEDREILEWVYHQLEWLNYTLIDRLDNYSMSTCLDTLCPKIGWQGDADLAGIGMFVNYVVQAALVTVFVAAFWVMELNPSSMKFPSALPRLRKCLLAITLSTQTFLDTSMLFCLAMHIASIVVFSKNLLADHPAPALYNVVTSLNMTMYSIVPVIVLHTLVKTKLRRQILRGLLWLILLILYICMGFMGFFLLSWDISESIRSTQLWTDEADSFWYDPDRLAKEPISDPDQQFWWYVRCLDLDAAYRFSSPIFGMGIALGIFLMFKIPFSLAYIKESVPEKDVPNIQNDGELTSEENEQIENDSDARTKENKNISNEFRSRVTQESFTILMERLYISSRVRLYVVTIGLIGPMWLMLVHFNYLRNTFGKWGGKTNKDDELSFGQVLSLVTWVPVVVDFVCIWWQGPVTALTESLTVPYKAVEESRADNNDAFGDLSARETDADSESMALIHRRTV